MKFLILLSLVLTIKSTHGLSCYSCNSKDNQNCGGNMTNTIGIPVALCTTSTACLTFVNKFNSDAITRGCSENFMSPTSVLNVTTCDLDGFTNRMFCGCQTDNCNMGAVGVLDVFKINECSSSPCKNNGTCIDLYNMYSCKCKQNFTGVNCESCIAGNTGPNCDVLVDMCKPDPCKNGGTCSGNQFNYTCACPAGYTNTNCSIRLDPCANFPCSNKGKCIDKVTTWGYDCNCTNTGYTGTDCSTDLDECTEKNLDGSVMYNCVNGSCVNNVGGYNCSCTPGFTDLKCSTNINECGSSPCINGGTCVDGVNGYKCTCAAGYTSSTGAENCQVNIDECATLAACSPTGSLNCTDKVNDYLCTCKPGYTDKNCSTDINECASNPCQFSSSVSCTDQVNSFNCTCSVGFTGPTCSSDIDECSSNPCKNGATCKNGLAKYECVCASGYTGINCESDLDECSSNPCYAPGTSQCDNGLNKYTCICLAGYTGTNCNTKIDFCTSTPCLNGGTCIPQTNGFTCSCDTKYYQGIQCEIPILRCSPSLNPCLNGATCNGGVGNQQLTCICAPGYTGPTCSDAFVDYCGNINCNNNGNCSSNQLTKTYMCTCKPGFTGTDCQTESFPCKTAGLFPDPYLCYVFYQCSAVLQNNGTTTLSKATTVCPLKTVTNTTASPPTTKYLQFLYSPLSSISTCSLPSAFKPYTGQTCNVYCPPGVTC